MNNYFVILAAGKSRRFHKNIAKQFYNYKNKEIIDHSIEKSLNSKLFKKILIITNKLKNFKKKKYQSREYGFVVHRTMADPKWLDPSIDPNGRKPNWCFLGEPEVVNNSPIGLARYCSLRSWLSQWSYDYARGDGLSCAKDITVPCLVIGNTDDDGITPSHTNNLYDSIGHENKQLEWIEGANHYYFGQPEKANESARMCKSWLDEKGFI